MSTLYKLQPQNSSGVTAEPLTLRCPFCRHIGVLQAVHGDDVQCLTASEEGDSSWAVFGLRRCPNTECRAAIFVVYHSGTMFTSYPPEVLDFDASNLPDAVLASFDEAIRAHAAGCYRAAAIMIRRTLEEICKDRSASGINLEKRLESLAVSVVLPVGFIQGLHGLRFLGNDAAHIEAKTYDNVGIEEVETAIDVLKVLLLSIYQYVDVLNRLKLLQQVHPPSPSAP
jgi:Domain of unknown function (DUF4145)